VKRCPLEGSIIWYWNKRVRYLLSS